MTTETETLTFPKLLAQARALKEADPEMDDKLDAIMIDAQRLNLSAARAEKLFKALKDTGLGVQVLRKAYGEKKDEGAKARREEKKNVTPETIDERTVIYTDAGNGYVDAVKAAWAVVLEKSKGGGYLYSYGADIVRLIRDEKTKRLRMECLTRSKLRTELNRHILWMTPAGKDSYESISCPPDIAEELFNTADSGLPILYGVTHTPFYVVGEEASGRASERGDVILIDQEGYHPAGYYYDPAGVKVTGASSDPTDEEVAEAKRWLFEEVYPNFPFDDGDGRSDSSKAHLFALLVQPLIRAVIDGPTPIYFVTKSERRTGAGLLIETTGLLATGEEPAAQTMPDNAEEVRKTIAAMARSGDPYAWFDNLSDAVDSSAIASASASGKVRSRKLGTDEMGEYPVTCTLIMDGNKPKVSDEIAMRCAPIRMHCPAPERRPLSEFKHTPLKPWVGKNRGEGVRHILNLLNRAFSRMRAGGVAYTSAVNLAGFEVWCEVMGGILTTLDMPGFLGNLDIVRVEANEENTTRVQLVEAWLTADNFGNWRQIGDPDEADDEFTSLVDIVDQNEIAITLKGLTGKARAQSLSAWVRQNANESIWVDTERFVGEVFIRTKKWSNGYRYALERGRRASRIPPAEKDHILHRVARVMTQMREVAETE
jgi:hypothetical protein